MRPHVMKAAPMLVLSVIAMCSQVQGEAVATGAGVLRGNHDVEQSHNAQIASNVVRRRLEDEDANDANDANDGDNDEAANNDENENEYYKYDDDANGWQEVEQETEDAQTNNSTMQIFVSKVQNYKANAESTAWEFYESPPSQWTSHQWDLVFALSCGILASCCLGAACCAYNCVKEDTAVDGEDLLPLSPKAREWTPRAYRSPSSLSTDKRKGKNISSHRNHFSLAQYKRYQEEQDNEAIDDDATVDTEMDGGQPPSASQTQCYSPPSSPAATTTSLADYTSVQREKEGRIFEAWKAEQSPKKTNSSNNNSDSNNNQPAAAASSRTKKSVVELDVALACENKNKKEDKLLEARERQHNLVGYYL